MTGWHIWFDACGYWNRMMFYISYCFSFPHFFLNLESEERKKLKYANEIDRKGVSLRSIIKTECDADGSVFSLAFMRWALVHVWHEKSLKYTTLDGSKDSRKRERWRGRERERAMEGERGRERKNARAKGKTIYFYT